MKPNLRFGSLMKCSVIKMLYDNIVGWQHILPWLRDIHNYFCQNIEKHLDMKSQSIKQSKFCGICERFIPQTNSYLWNIITVTHDSDSEDTWTLMITSRQVSGHCTDLLWVAWIEDVGCMCLNNFFTICILSFPRNCNCQIFFFAFSLAKSYNLLLSNTILKT